MSDTKTIFYSWQSDLPRESNQVGIRQSLRTAVNKIEDNLENIQIELDEATRKTTGSPNIPRTIFEKISKSDVFVSDITTINNDSNSKRKVGNPNVLVELGYAIATVGWERIIMVFNTNFGSFPKDLPFDIDRHRAIPFCIKDKIDKNGKSQLTSVLKTAIQAIIEVSPLRPSELKTLTPKEQKRELDIINLKWIMASINIQIFDSFIENMPSNIIKNILYFKEWFTSIILSNSFHIYDEKLLNLLEIFESNWDKSLSYYQHYNSDGYQTYKFHIPFDVFPNAKAEDDFKKLSKITIDLKSNFKDLLNYIRMEYLEIDLEETSKSAINQYEEDNKS
ncbi:MAG: hypothetical protein PSN34_07045 [Urechidicola sp.]|nr:hypothetical protein [Urechidicola sp.]